MNLPPEHLAAALADRYTIQRQLGEGGMATVYLAHDLKHDRQVAIKVLRPELAAIIGAERFLSEIKTTANLQHPHILPLFDSGVATTPIAQSPNRPIGEFLFYVMPYVEGESLRDRLSHEKQLPVAEAVRIASEVAAALDYAHRHNVIHRDIKPENVMLHDGSALVADFGIALAASKAGGTRMTETGMSLGTPTYMSPEQAMGEREITARSDVYALGCMTYEMLLGEPPFTGPTAQAIVAKVMTAEPARLTTQRKSIPPHVEAAVFTALEKTPADRFGSAAEFAAALADTRYQSTTLTAQMPAAAGPRGWRARAPLVLAGVAGLVLGAGAVAALRRPAPAPVTRYGLSLPASQVPSLLGVAVPSPDGARFAYVGPAEGGTQIWIKQRDRYEATPLLGTLNVDNFTWSPDGEWLAFTSQAQLKKIPVVGGAAITLTAGASGNPGLAWLDDGTIVFLPLGGGLGLSRVSAGGGTVTASRTDSVANLFASPLPGSRGVLFTRCAASCAVQQDLWVHDFRSGEAHALISGAAKGQYVPTGHVVYVRQDGGMLAVPFDLGSLKFEGSPVPIMDSVSVLDRVFPLMALSNSGTLVLRLGSTQSLLKQYTMVWVDRTGQETVVDPNWTFRMTQFGDNVGWALSPDGRRLAIGLATEEGDDIWVKQLPRGPLSRVSYDGAAEYRPRWMPDGQSLMFGSNRTGQGTGGLYRRPANGTGADSLVWRSDRGIFEGAWSPDRRWLLFRTGGVVGQTGGRDIVGIRPGVDSVPVPVVATPYDEEAIALSPDGRWLAYESNETGRTEIFLRPFPATDSGKWQVSSDGGAAPLWARNGRELFYVNGSMEMMAVTVAPGADPGLGQPRRLFALGDRLYMTRNEFYTPFDIGPDGRFIMARVVRSATPLDMPLVIVDNWFGELKQRMGGR
jgi:serine/threonine-protein kinase